MKKSFKAIVALMLAALFAVTLIPTISASEAPKTLTIKNESLDYTFTIYKVASLDTKTGKYTVCGDVDAAVVSAINTAGLSGADFLAALDSATKVGEEKSVISGLHGGKTTYTITSGNAENGDGIYYVKNNEKLVNNSVFVWPVGKATTSAAGKTWDWDYSLSSFDLGTKIKNPKITKEFTGEPTVAFKDAAQADVIKFTLTADIIGQNNAKDRIASYKIWDKMSPGLEYVKGSAHIYYDNTTTSAEADFDAYEGETAKISKLTDAQLGDEESMYKGGTYFEFNVKESVLNGSTAGAFYAHQKVIIQYSAVVLNSAGIGKDYNPNKDGLIYSYPGKDEIPVAGREVRVYTFAPEAVKIDGSATAKAQVADPAAAPTPLGGAKIGIYSDEKCEKLLASGTSENSTGHVTFIRVDANGAETNDANPIRLAPGTYYVKEISAPDGFALSTVVYPLTISAPADETGRSGMTGMFSLDGNKVIENFIPKMPETGGQGTLMFTLIGVGLIICAGVLFVILMKKKTTK